VDGGGSHQDNKKMAKKRFVKVKEINALK